jgi:hypothetical protein
MKWATLRRELLADPAVQQEYQRLAAEQQGARASIRRRLSTLSRSHAAKDAGKNIRRRKRKVG